jgi:hypothetical protein
LWSEYHWFLVCMGRRRWLSLSEVLVRVLNEELCKPFAAAAVSSFLGLGLVLDCHSCSLPSLVLAVISFWSLLVFFQAVSFICCFVVLWFGNQSGQRIAAWLFALLRCKPVSPVLTWAPSDYRIKPCGYDAGFCESIMQPPNWVGHFVEAAVIAVISSCICMPVWISLFWFECNMYLAWGEFEEEQWGWYQGRLHENGGHTSSVKGGLTMILWPY